MAVVVRRGDVKPAVQITPDAAGHVPTLVGLTLQDLVDLDAPTRTVRRPLSKAELTVGHSTGGDESFAAIALEARAVLARRYSAQCRIAAVRSQVAEEFLGRVGYLTLANILEGFDEQNEKVLRLEQRDSGIRLRGGL